MISWGSDNHDLLFLNFDRTLEGTDVPFLSLQLLLSLLQYSARLLELELQCIVHGFPLQSVTISLCPRSAEYADYLVGSRRDAVDSAATDND